MNVECLSSTPIQIALEAGLICTNSEEKIKDYVAEDFITKLVSKGHESIIEHLNYNFRVDGVSRALLQEISRHRHISLSVKSSRWALKKFIGKSGRYDLSNNELQITDEGQEILNKLNNISDELENLIKEGSEAGIANDILKYYIQESVLTKLILTLNARELLHIFKLRTQKNVLKEFRLLCKALYFALPEDHRFIYNNAVDDINSV